MIRHILPAYQSFLEEKYRDSKKTNSRYYRKPNTDRKKLVTIGIFKEIIQKNTYVYSLVSIGLESCTRQELEQLNRAVFIYKNIALLALLDTPY